MSASFLVYSSNFRNDQNAQSDQLGHGALLEKWSGTSTAGLRALRTWILGIPILLNGDRCSASHSQWELGK